MIKRNKLAFAVSVTLGTLLPYMASQAGIFDHVKAAESAPVIDNTPTEVSSTAITDDSMIEHANANSNSSSSRMRTRFGMPQERDSIEYDGTQTRAGIFREMDKNRNEVVAPAGASSTTKTSAGSSSQEGDRGGSIFGSSFKQQFKQQQAQQTQQTRQPTAQDLQKELAKTKKELENTKQKLQHTEETYGVIPTDENGNPLPEAVKQNIPKVPSSVVSNAPRYAANQGSNAAANRAADSPVMRVVPGVNQIVTISIGQPNRLITPFHDPQILSSALEGGQGNECGEVCVKGNVVYISTQKEYPMGLFITDKNNEQMALSLTLMPRRIPPREVHLELADSGKLMALSGGDDANVWETSQPFVNSVKGTMKSLALGEVPSGYHLQKIPSGYSLPVCAQAGIQYDFKQGQLVAGVNLNYVIGKAKNVSSKPLEIKESSCGGYDVAAVAAYPYNLLRPGESTEIYVVQRVKQRGSKQTVRRSLLQK